MEDDSKENNIDVAELLDDFDHIGCVGCRHLFRRSIVCAFPAWMTMPKSIQKMLRRWEETSQQRPRILFSLHNKTSHSIYSDGRIR